jgi:hypothetical protein
MNIKSKFVLSVIIAAIAATILYITLHELGHTVVAVACGARITNFSIINAKMAYEGGTFTPVTQSLLNVAGMIFPLLIAAISVCFYKKNSESIIYHIGYLFFTMVSTTAALTWIIIPITALFSQPPAGDDVTKFMLVSGWHPQSIAIGALLIFSLMIIWVFLKGLPFAFIQVVKTVQKS